MQTQVSRPPDYALTACAVTCSSRPCGLRRPSRRRLNSKWFSLR